MSDPILTATVDGKFHEGVAIHRVDLSWDKTDSTLFTVVQRRRGRRVDEDRWEDVSTVSRDLPQRWSEYIVDDLAHYRVVQHRRVAEDEISISASNEQHITVGFDSSTDQGFDPILGPPHQPINFQLHVTTDANGAHFNWNAPEFLLGLSYDSFTKQLFIYVNGYFQDPSTVSQSGTTVSVASGSFEFLPEMVGYTIRWKNSGIAVIQSVNTGNNTAQVTPSQSISAGQFALVPTGTTFDLYRWDEGDNWPRIGESTNSYPANQRVDWLNQELTGQEQFAWLAEEQDPQSSPVYGWAPGLNLYYVRAVSGATEKFSQVISITL